MVTVLPAKDSSACMGADAAASAPAARTAVHVSVQAFKVYLQTFGESRRRSGAAPHRVGRLQDTLELAPLVVLRQRHALAETALRAERELIERQRSGGLVDA